MPNAQCPMPNAPFPIPHSPFPIPHDHEKYIPIFFEPDFKFSYSFWVGDAERYSRIFLAEN